MLGCSMLEMIMRALFLRGLRVAAKRLVGPSEEGEIVGLGAAAGED